MLNFNEANLVSRLAKMSVNKRAAFAASCATRLLPLFEQYAVSFLPESSGIIREALTQAWRSIVDGNWNREIIINLVENIMGIMPEENIDWTPLHSHAEDAAASTAYALRTLIFNDPHDAGWAARRAYETVDLAVQKVINFVPGKSDSEVLLLSHPLIQHELQRQKQDLDELESKDFTEDTLKRIKKRAFCSPLGKRGDIL